MQPLSQHELSGHRQKLRQIFGGSFEAGGAPFELDETRVPSSTGPIVWYVLRSNASTEIVLNDRRENDVCAVLAKRKDKRILCSFFEKWSIIRPKKPQYLFSKAGITLFLSCKHGREVLKKQIFRLDWDNWKNDVPPNKAAYPHWQFDLWLTASELPDMNKLKEQFEERGGVARTFEPDQQGETPKQTMYPDRPYLGWFTDLHFPAIAPWATAPIKTQSHRSIPETAGELEDWIDSSLQYLKSELMTYA